MCAEEPGAEEDDSADYPDQVHPPERVADYCAGLIAAGEDAEGSGCDDETEEDIATEPKAQA